MHYCSGTLASWNINKTEEVACCCSSSEKATNKINFSGSKSLSTDEANDNCCSNKTISLKIDGDYHYSANYFHFDWVAQALIPTTHYFLNYQENFPTNNTTVVYQSNAPPLGLWQNIPLYILQSKYLVYDIA